MFMSIKKTVCIHVLTTTCSSSLDRAWYPRRVELGEYVVSDLQDYRVFRLLKLVTSILKGGNSGYISYIHYGKAGFSP